MELRLYQQEAKKAIFHEWQDKDKTLLVLPTGCGKTIVFADVAKERTKTGKVLILAHREELLNQASDKIKKLCGIDCAVEKAEKTSIGADEPITVGSVQTLMTEKRLSGFTPDYFDTVIVDEAHHALAKSYQNVLNHFDHAKVLGVTATPDRGDMQELGSYFESLAYEYSLRDAINQGYLSKIRVQTMPLKIDMTAVKVSRGDFQTNDIGNALEPYLEDIADEMVKVCKDRHTVVFLPLVKISQEFRDILNTKGFRAAEVNGDSKDREEVLADFAEGKYNVLCNSMLLTEGWDCPIVDCIIPLRPTKIRSLYCQMVGRGTRLYPGKDHLLILDFLWMTGKHNLVHPADIICKKKEIAEQLTFDLSEELEAVDLMEAEEETENKVLEQRKNALQKALEEAEKERKQKKLINPLEFELAVGDDALIDYVPTFGWEKQPITEKQKSYLEKMQIDATDMCKGKASKLIDRMNTRRELGLCTPRQAKTLTKFGFNDVYLWKFDEANSMLNRLAAVGWKKWKLNVDVENYKPISLIQQEVTKNEVFEW